MTQAYNASKKTGIRTFWDLEFSKSSNYRHLLLHSSTFVSYCKWENFAKKMLRDHFIKIIMISLQAKKVLKALILQVLI